MCFLIFCKWQKYIYSIKTSELLVFEKINFTSSCLIIFLVSIWNHRKMLKDLRGQ